MFTNEIHQIGRIYYMERLSDAALDQIRRRNVAGRLETMPSLSDRLGDWFISIGMKLKAQHGAPALGSPLAQR